MMLVDSHAHLDDPRFNDDREGVLSGHGTPAFAKS